MARGCQAVPGVRGYTISPQKDITKGTSKKELKKQEAPKLSDLLNTKKGRLSRPFVVMMGFGFFDLC